MTTSAPQVPGLGTRAARPGRRAALVVLARAVVQGRRPGSPGLVDRVRALPGMAFGALNGRYPALTRGRLAMLVLAVAYLVSPVDLVPEAFLSVFGLVDDGVVALWLGGALIVETQRYLDWQRETRVVEGRLA